MKGPAAIEVFPTVEALVTAAADAFARLAGESCRQRGRFHVALSGGSTPAPLYALLATGPAGRSVDWSRVHVYWGDERCVAPEDPASNYRMAREALLDRVPLPAANLHRMRGELPPGEAALAYERELRRSFATPAGPPLAGPGTRFDLVLLGMGADGHTASLFPGQSAVGESERWVVAQQPAGAGRWRLTLTPPVINAAAEVLFLVAGREKAATLHRVLDGPLRPDILPAQAIAPRQGGVCWFLDAAAAADLERTRPFRSSCDGGGAPPPGRD